jgi:hypothetical protein
MKKIIGFLLVYFASSGVSAFAENAPPYFTAIKGNLVQSLFEQDDVTIDPGTASGCTESGSQDIGAIRFDCTVAQASLTVKDVAGQSHVYNFATLTVFLKYIENESPIQEYHFYGTWTGLGAVPTTSESELMVYRTIADQTHWTGYFALNDLNISLTVRATSNASFR